MMRFLFGALLGLLVAVPTLLDLVLGIAILALAQPPLVVAVGGVLAWPRLTRTVRGWTL
ncbi:hypothetical protein [Streptomyces typhae]|uniref:hypothetical protein n=1 Tax=Streptomyces typhae TaxID=2681492 RepID=UPI0018DF7112|nr:hypothetical protein [Streptomyces typhae]